ncbi:MAG: hypothetical protein JSV31_08940 [Desulfobacterales bacterium]|nr:MAG: hypothetical protein JSV31_08940 [Desulfobacterales bacterium]
MEQLATTIVAAVIDCANLKAVTAKDTEFVVQLKIRVLKRNPDDFVARIGLASSYSMGGRAKKVRAAAAEVIRIAPKFSVEYVKTLPFKNIADRELLIDDLRKAGLPE